MPFDEDDAVRIASESSEAQKFEEKHPDAVWNVDDLTIKDTAEWIENHPDADITKKGKDPPRHLWIVEIEELEQEKLIFIISPDTEKVVDVQTEKLEAEPEDEDEDEDEGEDEE